MKLSEVIPWGRSYDEYRRMFALSGEDLVDSILGCGDGPASFNAEAKAKGHSVISCDPLYAFFAVEIEQRIYDCYDDVIAQVRRLEFPTKSGHGVKLYSVRSYSAGDTYPSEECRRLVL
jgi:hypothetical protein